MPLRRIIALVVLLGSLYFAASLRDGWASLLTPVFAMMAVLVAVGALAVVLFNLPWRRRDDPRFVSRAPLAACPACGGTALVDGRIHADRGEEGRAERFFPKGIGLFALRRSVSLNGRHPFRACASCGHLWSSFNPDELRELVETRGVPELKARLARRT